MYTYKINNPESSENVWLLKKMYKKLAIEYAEFKKMKLPENERKQKLIHFFEKAMELEEMMRKGDLSLLSEQEIQELSVINVDEKGVDELVNIYSEIVKIPSITEGWPVFWFLKRAGFNVEHIEEMDTTGFESELKKYLIEHYKEMVIAGESGTNSFLAAFPYSDIFKEMQRKFGLDSRQFTEPEQRFWIWISYSRRISCRGKIWVSMAYILFDYRRNK